MFTIDFESKSVADLKKCGSWRYSIDPTTEVTCLAFVDDDGPRHIWIPPWLSEQAEDYAGAEGKVFLGRGCPAPLADAIKRRELIEAHNVFFEVSMWMNQMERKYGWPAVPMEQWRCCAAKAAAAALPRNLDGALKACGFKEAKDKKGSAVMKKISKPRTPASLGRKFQEWLKKAGWSKTDDNGWTHETTLGTHYLWHEDTASYHTLWDYCLQDIRVEQKLSEYLPDLSADELEIWQVDQKVNLRGVHFDRVLASDAVKIAADVKEEETRKAVKIAGEAFETLDQRDKVLEWLTKNGCYLDNYQAETIKAKRKEIKGESNKEPDDPVYKVLTARQTTAKTSNTKYAKMLLTADPDDDRIRGIAKYAGAGTRRWTGQYFQPHNLAKGEAKNMDGLCAALRDRDWEWLDTLYNVDKMQLLSWAIRGAVIAPPGRDLACADFSGVEARGTPWFVKDYKSLEIFNRDKDAPGIYREMAAEIYGVPAESIDKEGDKRRHIGKQAILGLGYNMGAKTFRDRCADYGIIFSLDFAKEVVKAYRRKFFMTVQGWDLLNNAARAAVVSPGRIFTACRVAYKKVEQWLVCKLPSGGKMYYSNPRVEWGETPWGKRVKKLSYMSWKQGKWVRTDTYGGKLMENCVQALCRDLLAYSLVQVEKHPKYDPIMHVHDEVVAEVDEGMGDLEEFEALVARKPAWAEDFPLTAEGWIGKRYHK